MAPESSSRKNPYKCNEPGCNAVFERPYRLKDHKLAHLGESPYICDYSGCSRRYTNKSHLRRHKLTSHSAEEILHVEFKCGVEGCEKVLATKQALKKHISKNHNPQSFPFKCCECQEAFKRKTQLHQHMLDHGKEAPYKCHICPLTFVPYHLYQKHLKNHKTYQCDCNQVFDRWTQLCKHKRTECPVAKKEHKCTICAKTFSRRQNLTQHSLGHVRDSQNEVFKCTYLDCKRSYKQKRNLSAHIKYFHEKFVEEYKCTEKNCKTVLKSKKNLKQHLRICHSNLPPKIRQPRKHRKDKGKAKKSMASKLSGLQVSLKENSRNIIAEDEVLEGVGVPEPSEISNHCSRELSDAVKTLKRDLEGDSNDIPKHFDKKQSDMVENINVNSNHLLEADLSTALKKTEKVF